MNTCDYTTHGEGCACQTCPTCRCLTPAHWRPTWQCYVCLLLDTGTVWTQIMAIMVNTNTITRFARPERQD